MVYFLSGSQQQHISISGTSGTHIVRKTGKIKKIVTTGTFSQKPPFPASALNSNGRLIQWF